MIIIILESLELLHVTFMQITHLHMYQLFMGKDVYQVKICCLLKVKQGRNVNNKS